MLSFIPRPNTLKLLYVLGLFVFISPSALQAQEAAQNIDIIPAASSAADLLTEGTENTHPAVHMTPDKSELIYLDSEARTIIVGNPDHLSILADTSKTLILVPRQPGTTHFTVLDNNSEVIMQRHAIIASPKENYIRVRKACAAADDDSCQETSVFYCPDMCHEISNLPPGEGNESAGAGPVSTASSEQNNGSNENTP